MASPGPAPAAPTLDPREAQDVLLRDLGSSDRCVVAGRRRELGRRARARPPPARGSLRSIGFFSNRLLLWGIAFELAFAAAVIYVPPLRAVFGTAALPLGAILFTVPFPLIVWGVDALVRSRSRPRQR